jgi:hypothetical protein
LILTLVRYFLFCTNIYMKKEARDMEKAISGNIPDCLREKSQAYSSAWPKLPALWATWRPGKADQPKRASLARRESAT